MTVELLNYTPLHICSKAIRKCWASENRSDTTWSETCQECGSPNVTVNKDNDYICNDCHEVSDTAPYQLVAGPIDRELIDRVGNKNKHASTLEHLYYTFDIDGISRACLQELVRHRIASYSVKSSRYTLKELKVGKDIHITQHSTYDDCDIEYCKKFLKFTGDKDVDLASMKSLYELQVLLRKGKSNDKAKFAMPEAYKTSLVITFNARSIQNFLTLRTAPAALWEIRELALAIYKALPEHHKYLFEDSVHKTLNHSIKET